VSFFQQKAQCPALLPRQKWHDAHAPVLHFSQASAAGFETDGADVGDAVILIVGVKVGAAVAGMR
jgi:hypothetical protein